MGPSGDWAERGKGGGIEQALSNMDQTLSPRAGYIEGGKGGETLSRHCQTWIRHYPRGLPSLTPSASDET